MNLTPYQYGLCKEFSATPSRFNVEPWGGPAKRGVQPSEGSIDGELLKALIFENGGTLASHLVADRAVELLEIEWVSLVYELVGFRWQQEGDIRFDVIGIDPDSIKDRYLELIGAGQCAKTDD